MSGAFGLSAAARGALLNRLSARRKPPEPEAPAASLGLTRGQEAPPLGHATLIASIALLRQAGESLGLEDPYHRPVAGIAGATVMIGNRLYDNFTSYNYLGLNGDSRVNDAAKAAIDLCGTSVSASRIVSGERQIHRDLEAALADCYGAEACLALVSGHATNVTVIAHLVDRNDVVLHDSLSHNSIAQGAIMSGARRVSFAHNDPADLDRVLGEVRSSAKRALIVIEGHYSMDGDVPDLRRFIAIARRWGASVMVDEAHSLGVLGATGRGVAELTGVDGREIDIWMGTLSKTLSGCGGYIAGSSALIDYLRNSVPGFVYSVGMAPPVAGAAIEALRIMRAEPERVARLQRNGGYFLAACRDNGLDTGTSVGLSIVPVIVGSSVHAARAAQALFEQGVNVQPILHPAVPERGARLRFFISSLHTEEQLSRVAAITAKVLAETAPSRLELAHMAASLALSKLDEG